MDKLLSELQQIKFSLKAIGWLLVLIALILTWKLS